MARQIKIEDLFHEARAKPTAEEREAYLAEACGEDAELRERIRELLRADLATGFFSGAAPTSEMMGEAEVTEGVGTTIGRYKLLQLIGEGGFGLVFMAEQREPVVRRVALKVIKLGMDTRQVIARFEAERQALAMMDHPNIARVIDAGATLAGRPYFVMELVQGEPITDFCDRNHLSIRQRLELFEQVCQAVQHAHGKGIIHRDIKPSNVLVSERDGRPWARVIDFGIAKAVSARLTERTLFTDHRGFVGTPAYMSPEQAGAAVDVDVRSDVYSLGVLLYELLTGTTPFEPKALREAALGEVQRLIREVDPPAPSTRLSQNRQTLAGVAASRKVEPAKLGVLVRGDLDWVVMKALEKDRSRRYATASDLGADVVRHLRDEVVTATPPGQVYRLAKLVRRNRVAFAAAAAVVLAMAGGLTASSVMFVRERSAHAQTVAALRAADEARDREAQQRRLAEQNFAQARKAVDAVSEIAVKELADRPEVASSRQRMLERAAEMYEGFLATRGDDAAVLADTVNAYALSSDIRDAVGQSDASLRHLTRAVELNGRLLRREPDNVAHLQVRADLMLSLSHLQAFELGKGAAGVAAAEEAIALRERICKLRPDDPEAQVRRFNAMGTLGWAMRMNEDREGFVEVASRALAERREAEKRWPALADGKALEQELAAQALDEAGRFAEAEKLLRESLALRRERLERLPEDDLSYHFVAQTLTYLNEAVTFQGRPAEGAAFAREAIEKIGVPVRRHPQFVWAVRSQGYMYEGLGNALRAAGRAGESGQAYLQAKEIQRQVYERNPDVPGCIREYLPLLCTCQDPGMDEPARAVVIGRRLVELAPRAKSYRIQLAAAQLASGDARGAVGSLRAAADVEPKGYGWAGHLLALSLHRAGDDAGARQALADAEVWLAANPPRWREPRRFVDAARAEVGK